jgi:PiT family inorganic phosphate transporter
MGGIAASWVISPFLGGLIAAAFLAFIKTFIIYQEDKIAAARKWVPVLIGVMSGTFASYLALKGLKKIVKIDMPMSLVLGVVVGLAVWAIVRPLIRRQSEGLENRNQSLRILFSVPLVCSAALLSFAHGANDVANAVGPLAAIVHTAELGDVAAKVSIPLWVMAVGAFGISFGLLLFGPRLIEMVGQQITKLNPMRAYCVSLSAAITVIVASGFGGFRRWVLSGVVYGTLKTAVGLCEQDTGQRQYRQACPQPRGAGPSPPCSPGPFHDHYCRLGRYGSGRSRPVSGALLCHGQADRLIAAALTG